MPNIKGLYMTERIEFLDLAKGIGIFLVVFIHAQSAFGGISWLLKSAIQISYLPLFFFLSGVFFKTYNSYSSYLKKKINTLLIPFLFFHISGCIILPYLNLYKFEFHQLYDFLFHDGRISNVPCWFIICLFVQGNIFYLIHFISQKVKNRLFCILFLSVLMGIIGWLLSTTNTEINIGMNFKTALTTMPYFALGYVIKNYSIVLDRKYKNVSLSLYSIFALIITVVLAEPAEYFINSYDTSLWRFYLCGFVGLSFFISISMIFEQLPFFSFLGKNSLIVLLSHNPYIQRVMPILFRTNIHQWWLLSILGTIIVGVSYYLLVPLFKRIIPWFVAKKEIIK